MLAGFFLALGVAVWYWCSDLIKMSRPQSTARNIKVGACSRPQSWVLPDNRLGAGSKQSRSRCLRPSGPPLEEASGSPAAIL
jgi:hypothetical protein